MRVAFLGASEAIVQQPSFALSVPVTCWWFFIGAMGFVSILVSKISCDHQRHIQMEQGEIIKECP